jgi:hypothetical protein
MGDGIAQVTGEGRTTIFKGARLTEVQNQIRILENTLGVSTSIKAPISLRSKG